MWLKPQAFTAATSSTKLILWLRLAYAHHKMTYSSVNCSHPGAFSPHRAPIVYIKYKYQNFGSKCTNSQLCTELSDLWVQRERFIWRNKIKYSFLYGYSNRRYIFIYFLLVLWPQFGALHWSCWSPVRSRLYHKNGSPIIGWWPATNLCIRSGCTLLTVGYVQMDLVSCFRFHVQEKAMNCTIKLQMEYLSLG